MSDTPDTKAQADHAALEGRLKAQQILNKLTEEEIRGKALANAQKRVALRENYDEAGWSFVGAWGDILDRLRGPDGNWFLPFSTAADRRFGDNWPFWRSWEEHARIRAAARMLCATSNQAVGMIGGLSGYVVGDGYKWKAQARNGQTPPPGLAGAVQQAIDDFLEEQLWGEHEIEYFTRDRRDGECFLRHFPGADGMLRVRFVNPEQVMNHPSLEQDEGKYGILTDPDDTQGIYGYWICLSGDSDGGVLADAAEVTHSKINVDRDIKRGLTDFSFDTLDTLKSAGRLLENLAEGSAIQASIALVREYDNSPSGIVEDFVSAGADRRDIDPVTGQTVPTSKYGKGRIEDMPKGRKYIAPPFAAYASQHVAVAQAVLRSAGTRWNAPEWLISGDASNSNYSSSLVAEAPFTRRCQQWQSYYRSRFLRVVKAAVKCACDANRLIAGGRVWAWAEVKALIDITGEPPRLQVRNPLEVAQENQILVEMGARSVQKVTQELGDDPEQTAREIAERVAALAPPPTPGMQAWGGSVEATQNPPAMG